MDKAAHFEILDRAAAAVTRRLRDLTIVRERIEEGGRWHQGLAIYVGESEGPLRFRVTHPVQEVSSAHVRASTLLRGERDPGLIVVGAWIESEAKELAAERAAGYLDGSGNAHIEAPGMYLHVEDATAPRRSASSEVRAFQSAGQRLVFCLLIAPDLLKGTFRDLAEISGVARGTVGYVLNNLVKMGLLAKSGAGRGAEFRVLDREQLLEQWAWAYARSVSAAEVSRFQPREGSALDLLEMRDPPGLWGGDGAERLLAGTLAGEVAPPGSLPLYTRASPGDVMRRLRVLPDPDGAVEIRRPIWTERFEADHPPPAPPAVWPVLAFADLQVTLDPRAVEAARELQTRILR